MTRSYISNNEEETYEIAHNVANELVAGQIILLEGTLGAGKSSFVRALIRHLSEDPSLTVPSPTFTICQSYQTKIGDVWHYDLYRLKDPEEVYETGWEDIIDQDIILVEWPDRLGYLKPKNALMVSIEIENNNRRKITITHDK